MIDKERLRIFLEPPDQRSGKFRDLTHFGKQFLSKKSEEIFYSLASSFAACARATPKPGSLASVCCEEGAPAGLSG
jgi:hypothetical protein